MTERTVPGAGVFALMALLCAVWGLQQVAIKIAIAGISPIMQVGLRSAGAALLVLIWSRWRGVTLFRDVSLAPLGVMVGLLFALEFVCIYRGLQFTSASRMVVFLYTAPCFTVLGLHWFAAGERVAWPQALGVGMAFIGVVVAFADGMTRTTNTEFYAGDALGVLAAVLWAATTVLIRATPLARTNASEVLLYQLLVSAVIALPLSWWLGEPGITAPTSDVMLAMAYQVVIVAFASYLTWFWMLTRYVVSRLTVFSFLTPLFGVVFGVLLLDEPVGAQFGAAALMVAAGILLVNSSPWRR